VVAHFLHAIAAVDEILGAVLGAAVVDRAFQRDLAAFHRDGDVAGVDGGIVREHLADHLFQPVIGALVALGTLAAIAAVLAHAAAALLSHGAHVLAPRALPAISLRPPGTLAAIALAIALRTEAR